MGFLIAFLVIVLLICVFLCVQFCPQGLISVGVVLWIVIGVFFMKCGYPALAFATWVILALLLIVLRVFKAI